LVQPACPSASRDNNLRLITGDPYAVGNVGQASIPIPESSNQAILSSLAVTGSVSG